MLSEHVDTLITIPNQKLLSLGDEDLSFVEAFRKADEVLYQAIKGISDLITQNGIVNVDFADVKTVMSNMGRALMGTGCAKGQGRARLAAEMAVSSPLLDDISVEGATGVLINIVGGPDMRMREIEEAATLVQEQAHEDANIIFGATVDETMGDDDQGHRHRDGLRSRRRRGAAVRRLHHARLVELARRRLRAEHARRAQHHAEPAHVGAPRRPGADAAPADARRGCFPEPSRAPACARHQGGRPHQRRSRARELRPPARLRVGHPRLPAPRPVIEAREAKRATCFVSRRS
jgi:hypothetical protein